MIPQRLFGRTGHHSAVVLFGAVAFANVTQAEADRAMEMLLDYGINHIDTAAGYGDAEDRLGPLMEKYRDRFFLATKTGERDYAAAKAQIHRSLARMRVDSIDLIQLHNLGHPDEWDTAMGENGALEAAREARDQGLVNYIGVTGHGLKIAAFHHRSLRAFDFDSILLPWNIQMKQNRQYADDFKRVVRLAQERGAAVQTIKSLLRGPWGTTPKSHRTWYQPLEEQADIDRAVHWILAQEDLFLNTAGDINLLPGILAAASRFDGRGPSDEEMTAMVAERSMTPLFA